VPLTGSIDTSESPPPGKLARRPDGVSVHDAPDTGEPGIDVGPAGAIYASPVTTTGGPNGAATAADANRG